jgi:hypothetical protein
MSNACTAPTPRPLTSKLEENRMGLEEARAIARRIRAVVDCNRNIVEAKGMPAESPISCMSDDINKQHEIIVDIIDELNQLGQIVGY